MWQVRCPGSLSSWNVYLCVCTRIPTYHTSHACIHHILYTWIRVIIFQGFKMIEELVRRGTKETAQLVKFCHTSMWPELDPQHPYRKPGWLGPTCNPSMGESMGFTSLPAYLGKSQVPERDTFSKNKVDRIPRNPRLTSGFHMYTHTCMNMPIFILIHAWTYT